MLKGNDAPRHDRNPAFDRTGVLRRSVLQITLAGSHQAESKRTFAPGSATGEAAAAAWCYERSRV